METHLFGCAVLMIGKRKKKKILRRFTYYPGHVTVGDDPNTKIQIFFRGVMRDYLEMCTKKDGQNNVFR